jgi:hypothetical protein
MYYKYQFLPHTKHTTSPLQTDRLKLFREIGTSSSRGSDKSLAFPIFLFAAQPKEFFLDGLKKLEQRSHKCVELRGEYVK